MVDPSPSSDPPVVSRSGELEKGVLFKSGAVILHSGAADVWKIDCDVLTDGDWFTLAHLIVLRVGRFSAVEGVPRGGARLARELCPYVSTDGPLLIVDDVLTTGGSMEAQRAGREAIGAVIFARGQCPSWVTPLFVLTDDGNQPPRGLRGDPGVLGTVNVSGAHESSPNPSTALPLSLDLLKKYGRHLDGCTLVAPIPWGEGVLDGKGHLVGLRSLSDEERAWAIRVTFANGRHAFLREGGMIGRGPIATFRTKGQADAEAVYVREGLSDEDVVTVIQRSHGRQDVAASTD